MSSITLREIVATGFRSWKMLLACILIPPILAIGIAFQITPQFQAAATILVKTGREFQARSEVGDTATGAPIATKRETINSEIEIITSAGVAEETLRRIGVQALSPTAINRPFATVVEEFRKSITAQPVRDSSIIEVALRHPEPQTAERILELLVAVYLERHIDIFSEPRAKYIETQIDDLSKELKILENRRQELRYDHSIYSVEAQRSALISQRFEAQRTLDAIEADVQAAQKRVEVLNRSAAKVNSTDVITEDMPNDAFIFAENQLTQLKATRDQLLKAWPASNRRVTDIQARIAAAEAAMRPLRDPPQRVRTEPNKLAARLSEEIILIEASIPALHARRLLAQQAIQRATEELGRIENVNAELARLDQQYTSLLDNIKNYRDRLVEARLREDLDRERVTSVRVVQAATAAVFPVSPKKAIFAMGGIAAGLMAAAAALIAAIALQNTFLMPEAVERILGEPVLISIGIKSGLTGDPGAAGRRFRRPGGGTQSG